MLRKIGNKAFALSILIPTVYLLILGTPQLVLADITCENSDYNCRYVDQTPGSTQIIICSRSVCGSGSFGGRTYRLEGLYAFDGVNPNSATTTTAATTTTVATATTTTVATATTTAATTTTTAGSAQFSSLGLSLLQLSENQFQVRPVYNVANRPLRFSAGSFSESYTISQNGAVLASGSWTHSGLTGILSASYDTDVISTGTGCSNCARDTQTSSLSLKPGTTYDLSVTGGIPGNMVSASRSITTNGSTATSSTISGGTTTTTTTVFYNDPAPYMARINSSNVVIDVCVCSESFVRENPSRYPGTWVPMWMGVNGKNYAGVGWWYDAVAQNFYPQQTTTTTVAPTTKTTNPRKANNTTSTTTTIAVDAVEDDGQSEGDYADIGVSLRSGKFDMRISSSFPETEMMLRAFKRGSKSIIWNMKTNANGSYRILTTRALKGFTLSLWIDGDKWDSLVVR